MTNEPPKPPHSMSPLATVLMRILRSSSYAAAVLLVLFGGIYLWQQRTPEGEFLLTKQDYSVLAILALLAALAIYLVRGIAKEMNNPGG